MQTITPIPNGSVTSPKGFKAGVGAGQIKYKDRDDVAVVVSEPTAVSHALFTTNQVAAAPVLIGRKQIAKRQPLQAVVINAGNANACTGTQGITDTQQMQAMAGQALGYAPEAIFVMSTGVIGVPLPMPKVQKGIETAVASLSPNLGNQAAQAIMTTDTHPKSQAVQLTLSTGTVTIGGMCKGAGMIHPNMATMLALVTTDAELTQEEVGDGLQTAVAHTFNRITIDGDTSTNDTILLMANGASGVSLVTEEDKALFAEGLTQLCRTLAQAIVRDGEGVTKFVEIQVTGAKTEAEAHAIANTIGTSPLVKTAFAGSDANWGRILAAAGRAGVVFEQTAVSLSIGKNQPDELQLLASGLPLSYAEADAASIFSASEFIVQVDIGAGSKTATVWTSDLTHEYITINADYRT